MDRNKTNKPLKSQKNRLVDNTNSNSNRLGNYLKDKEICTCTKSGCNKNYCECFKIGQKCTALCRCIGCENNDQIQNKKYNYNYQCNLANSIYIVKNKLIIEDIKTKLNGELYGEVAPIGKCDFIGINKKRKREENKDEDNKMFSNINNSNNFKNKKIRRIKEKRGEHDTYREKNEKAYRGYDQIL